MKLQIKAGELIKRLADIAPMCDRKGAMPILSCVRIGATAEGLSIDATNMDHWITVQWKPETGIVKPGVVCVCAKMLLNVLASFSEVTIEAVGQTLEFTEGKNKAKLMTLPESEFPSRPTHGEMRDLMHGKAEELAEELAWLSKASSTDMARPMLLGVAIYPHHKWLAASDGRRAHSSAVETVGEWKPDDAININAGSLRFALPVMKGDGSCKFLTDGFWLQVRVGDWELWARLIDQSVPHRQMSVFFPNLKAKLSANKPELLDALKACRPMISPTSVSVSIAAEMLGMTISASFDGQSIERFVSGGGGEVAFNLNPQFLADALAGSGEQVEISYRDEVSPFILEANHRRAVMMPMRRGKA
jgi:DNA polymerase III subunit beta